uniref:Uncharacterized protein n=1 Tax=Setaria italica TaxID=4555 RepID=K4AHR2_SETIT
MTNVAPKHVAESWFHFSSILALSSLQRVKLSVVPFFHGLILAQLMLTRFVLFRLSGLKMKNILLL